MQCIQQQLEDASAGHKHEEQQLRQTAADASSAPEQEVRAVQQQLHEASVAHRQEVEGLQQQQQQALVEQSLQHDGVLSQVRMQICKVLRCLCDERLAMPTMFLISRDVTFRIGLRSKHDKGCID